MNELIVDGEAILLSGYELERDSMIVHQGNIIVGDDFVYIPVYTLDGDVIVHGTRVLDGNEIVFPIVFHALADLTDQVVFPKGLVSNGETIFNDGFRSEKENIFSKGFISKFLSKFLVGILVRGGMDADTVTAEKSVTSKSVFSESVSSKTITAEHAKIKNGEFDVAKVHEDLTVVNSANIGGNVKVGNHIGSTKYTPGLNGWSISSDGTAELKNLNIREFLDVPELRYNRVSVIAGEEWSAPGGGIIAEVGDGEFDLKLEDGELPTLDEDDICKGIFHSERGFSTCYFRVLEVQSTGKVKYILRENYDFPPQQFMHIVAYGNFTKKDRQYSALRTREYTRYYQGVNKWDIDPNMIVMQLGNLKSLLVGKRDLSGYSAYLKNIYMTGTIKQLSSDGETESDIPFFKGAWVKGPKYYWYDEVTHTGSTWLCIARL